MRLFASTMYNLVSFLAARRGLVAEETEKEGETSRASRSRQAGIRGETLAYWYLRQQGYVVVARNYRVAHPHGEIDLIGWDGEVLAFVEVKTRTTVSGGPPERSVDAEKQQALQRMARDYLRRRRLAEARYRFDVLALEAGPGAAPVVRLHKGAFGAD
jgi:putative endonuclease